MKISIIGCGYLGAVHAASMAELGHEVVGVDVDPGKVELLAQGRSPFYEPGFDEVLARNVEAGRLTFTTDYTAIAGAQVHFIGVGTPQSASGAADMTYVDAAIAAMVPFLGQSTDGLEVVAGKSTVPVGTAARLAPQVAQAGATLVWNPEFLREGFAVKDTLEPDRMVYGLPANPELAQQATAVMDEVYAPIITSGTPRLTMDYATAELVKISANSFLATKIGFINAVAQVCDAVGGDVTALAEAIGLDERIGHRFLRAGLGFGGGCLPKDIRAFQARASEVGAGQALGFLNEIDTLNNRMIAHAVSTAQMMLDDAGAPSAPAVTILGAAFKPDSDDTRNSPALALARALAKAGARVTVTDPKALPVVRRVSGDDMPFSLEESLEAALRGADLVVVATEWGVYRQLDPEHVGQLVARRQVLDARNALEPERWTAAGWTYHGIGRNQ